MAQSVALHNTLRCGGNEKTPTAVPPSVCFVSLLALPNRTDLPLSVEDEVLTAS